MLRTRFTEMFGLDHPIMSAPMAGHSGGTLAAAVSQAGGLGSFGAMSPGKGPDWVRAEVARIRDLTDRPFAPGFITPFLEFAEKLFDATLELEPPAIALSFAHPQPWIDRAHAVGALVICQVQSPDDADAAVAAGADVLAAQGAEAGGHTGHRALLPFLAEVVGRHPDVPVLAAGGLADGAAVAAVLAAGADGAWVGSAFLTTNEAVEVPELYQRLILESDGDDTVLTRAYDVASGLPWPDFVVDRVRRNRFTDEWSGRESELAARRNEFAATAAADDGPLDPDVHPVRYGTGAGRITAIRSAADVVRDLSSGAERSLRARVELLA